MADGLDLGTLKIKIKAEGAQQTQKELKDVADATGNAEQKSKGTQSAMKGLGSAFIDAVKNTKVFGMSLGDLASGLGDSATQSAMLGGAMGALVNAGINIAIQAFNKLISTMKELVVETFNVGVGFQAQMSRVSAIVGATGKEAEQLTAIAKKFGAETVFSSSEAGKALEYMGMAGWKTQQMMDGMPGILSLAAASGEDLALVSDIVTDALTAFGEEANQAQRMADVLAASATNSNTNVSKMGLTMQYAAPIAGALSYSMEDVAVAAGLMANAGIKGEKSGTALRSMFTELMGTVEVTGKSLGKYVIETENADGSMRELNELLVDLRAAFSQLSESEKAANAESLVGKEAMSGFLAVVNASEADFNKLTDAINNSAGASEKMSAQMTDNIDGLQKSISSKFESIQLSIFSVFEPLISGGLKIFNSMANWWEKLAGGISGYMSKWVEQITPFVDVIVAIFDTLVDLVWPLIEPLFLFVEAMFSKNLESLKTLGNACIAVIEEIKNALMPFVEVINNIFMTVVDVINGDWKSAMSRLENAGVLAAQGVVNAFLLIPNAIIAVINAVIDGINEMMNISIEKIEYITADVSGLFGKSKDELTDMATGTKSAFNDVGSSIKEACEDGETAIEELSKTYKDYLQKNMSDYEKQLREQFNGGTLAEEKKIQRKLALHEEMLKRQLEEDEKYEKRRAEIEKKYRMQSVTENGRTSISYVPRYANGTLSATGGLSVVGEVGRELMYVPPRAQIINNNTTEKILSGAGGPRISISNMTVVANDVQEFVDAMKMAVISGELA